LLPRKLILSGLASLCALVSGLTAHADWQGAFHVTCFRCRQQAVAGYAPPVVASYAPSVAYYSDPCCQPCAPPAPVAVAETRYLQRTCYQPVTTYQCQKYYQPVTVNQVSYYYEPVTSCRYTCAYDPCTCSYRYVAQQVTSYHLRSRCCPVTSYVERSAMVPVTSYRATTYYEPYTTYKWVDPCSGQVIGNGQGAYTNGGGMYSNGGGMGAPAVPAVPAVPGPNVSEQSTRPPQVQESRSGAGMGGSSPLYQQPGSQPLPQAPMGSGSSYRQGQRPAYPPAAQPQQQIPFQPKLDRITSKPVDSNWTPAKLAKHIIVD
jgi:hypothetical protein